MNHRVGGNRSSSVRELARSVTGFFLLLALPAVFALMALCGQSGPAGQSGRPGAEPKQGADQGRPSTTESGAGQSSQSGPNPTSIGQTNTGTPTQKRTGQEGPAQQRGTDITPHQTGGSGRTGEPAGTTTRSNVPVFAPQGGAQTPGAAKVVDGPTTLTLADAVRLAVENNLSTLLASEGVQLARGQARALLAGLLPNLSGSVFQENRTVNLKAQGFAVNPGPGAPFSFPTFVGPFNTFDARLFLAQNIFSLSAIRDYRSARTGVRVAELEVSLAREQIASTVALAFVNALHEQQAVEAAKADLTLAEALLKLAEDQRRAGVATGIDVVRAQNRAVQQRVVLLQAQSGAEEALLTLQRIVGLRQGAPLTLSESLRFSDAPLPGVAESVGAALAERYEIKIAEETVRQRGLERSARLADQYPSLEAFGDYGSSGNLPTENARATRTYGLRVNIPIFNGGLTRARIEEASSLLRQAQLQLSDTRGRVEEDVRLALIALRTAALEVRAANENFALAERELQLARDRFQAGLGDNIEVINAQTALQAARSNQVTSLARYVATRVNLAAAMGQAAKFRF